MKKISALALVLVLALTLLAGCGQSAPAEELTKVVERLRRKSKSGNSSTRVAGKLTVKEQQD